MGNQIYRERALYFLFIPVFLYYLIFAYIPLGGILLAFKRYSPALGIFGSDWIGFDNFIKFFSSYNFGRILWNTIRISLCSIAFNFPAPIILAILLNEVRNTFFKKTVQTITYLPHFISLVVAIGLLTDFLARDGIFNNIRASMGLERIAFMMEENYFTPIYVISGIWQQVGWGSIIYLAAISGISQDLYEAAEIDGAGRFRKMWHITLSEIMPTITVLFIMQLGKVMSVGYEKIILMSNDLVLAKSEVISSYVYKLGFGTYPDYGYSTAVNLFNMVVNLIILCAANWFSRRVNETSLW
ncbi:sugar ABC transporter permease [Lachnospiraceae bacterium MD329]|nr:sugar ABC transporter permease [Lachnospiraceae bacterium MD329]